MIFVSHYDSPLGMIYMAADDDVLKGVWFEGQKYFASGLDKKETEDKETPVLKQMEDPAYDPVWKDHDIRGDRQESR